MGLSDLSAAVVGVGFVGVAHVEALRRLGVRVAGVVGSDPERARRKAEAANLPRVYGSLDELLADPDVDVVHVASPNHVHAEQVRAVLEVGKHVVCEKPLALSSAETADLLRRAERSGLVHAVCYNVRFYPLCHQMRAMVRAGAIGEPRFVTGSYLQDWLLLPTDWNWRLEPEKAGPLRAVADIGSHWLDLAAFVTGRRVVEVLADLHTFVPRRRHPPGPVETFAAAAEGELVEEEVHSDDAAGILLRFEGGTRGVLAVSQVAAGRKNALCLEVDGSEASLAWCSEDPDRLWVGHRGRPNELLPRDPALVAPEVRPVVGYPGGHVEGYPDTFRALFAAVYADVERGQPSPAPAYPTFADGHEALCVLDAVARSAREGRWVAVERRREEEGA
ncbi:MAG TPA: Gfo/Idh/MocA family oxidoreductase [Actinomycetota bacterium]|nr:Gfo/Idh/MocA family oxidoreductase [Actinomycetota bacterium]